MPLEAGADRLAEIALEVDVAVEVAVQQADVAEPRDAPFSGPVPETYGETRRLVAVAVTRSVGEGHLEGDRHLRAYRFKLPHDQRSHRLAFLRTHRAGATRPGPRQADGVTSMREEG